VAIHATLFDISGFPNDHCFGLRVFGLRVLTSQSYFHILFRPPRKIVLAK
jgi:hypothetical protein